MDNLILIRVAHALHGELAGCVLREVRGEGQHRYRLRFDAGQRSRTVIVSLRPELPWIGRPAGPIAFASREDALTRAASGALRGAVVEAVEKLGADRVLRLRFRDGHGLVAELATHGANLILLDTRQAVAVAARHPRRATERLATGKRYRPPALPRGLLVPFGADLSTLASLLERETGRGEALFEVLRRRLFGVGSEGARLVAEEAAGSPRAAAEVLAERLAGLRSGRLDPVIAAQEDPGTLAARGDVDGSSLRLLPWDPKDGRALVRRSDAAATAGLYHEAVERQLATAAHVDALRGIVRAEVRRLWEAGRKIRRDITSFENPERFRRWGEALLAGLSLAQVRHGHATVRDPYDPDRDLLIPVRPGEPLTREAERYFGLFRRAERGVATARRRLEAVGARRERLEELLKRSEGLRGEAAISNLESAMQELGIPVGLGARRRRDRGALKPPARAEGVRMFRSSDAEWILVGRSGPANQRLTFKLAAPDDFWFHALGRPGAHVVVRNPRRRPRPPTPTLEEAAALAAWYSQGRTDSYVEVQWCRRKNVRRLRGAPPGTVTVKRFETVRVRPDSLEALEVGS